VSSGQPSKPEWTDAGTLLLPIAPGAWPRPAPPLRLDGTDFLPKRELHVTIAGRALGAELLRAMQEDPGIRASFERVRAGLDWDWHRCRAWLWLRQDDGPCRKDSIIERIELPAMAAFHAHAGQWLGRTLPVPPPHVTLYTAGTADGIGVADAEALERLLLRPVRAAELPGTS
jgi:hypothetical protein